MPAQGLLNRPPFTLELSTAVARWVGDPPHPGDPASQATVPNPPLCVNFPQFFSMFSMFLSFSLFLPMTQPGRPRCPTPLSVSSQLSSNRRFQVSTDLPWQHVQVTHRRQSSTPSFWKMSPETSELSGKARVASVYTYRCLLCSAAIKIWQTFSHGASIAKVYPSPKIAFKSGAPHMCGSLC